jgi:hypothetical protein
VILHARSILLIYTLVHLLLEAGASIEEVIEWLDVTREQVTAVLDFAARSLEPTARPATRKYTLSDIAFRSELTKRTSS